MYRIIKHVFSIRKLTFEQNLTQIFIVKARKRQLSKFQDC